MFLTAHYGVVVRAFGVHNQHGRMFLVSEIYDISSCTHNRNIIKHMRVFLDTLSPHT